jgi:hypothetical protein
MKHATWSTVGVLCGCLTVSWAASQAGAEQPPAPDAFREVAFLVGSWEGQSDGQPGSGTVRRQYERVLNGKFVRVHNTSTYAPQPKNPKGEVHQDVGYFSRDGARNRLVLRQFHVEGFVNQYVQEPGTLVFVSEAIENIPAGYRARETYVSLGPDAFEETFELAEPGKDWAVYSRARFTRVR